MLNFRFYGLLLIALLAGCSSTPKTESPTGSANGSLSWSEHKNYLATQNFFQAEGKIAIRQDGKRSSARLQWQQTGDQYEIFITGPLGGGSVKINGSPTTVAMEISGEGRFYAKSPENLMQQRLGWSLPISNLRYWAKGIPAPGSEFTQALNPQQRLAQLRQDNWLIEYQTYHQLDDTEWPRKMQLYYGKDIQVTMLIKQWHRAHQATL